GLLAAFCTVGILSAALGPTGSESLIELVTYFWLCLSLVVICKLLGSRERARRVLSAWRWAGVVACAAGGAATVLLWRGSLDNLLVQGGRVAGLFEGINQLQSFMMAVIPFLCATAFSSSSSPGVPSSPSTPSSAWDRAGSPRPSPSSCRADSHRKCTTRIWACSPRPAPSAVSSCSGCWRRRWRGA